MNKYIHAQLKTRVFHLLFSLTLTSLISCSLPMKLLNSIQLPSWKNYSPKTVLLAILSLTLLTIIPLYSPLIRYHIFLLKTSSSSSSSSLSSLSSLGSQDLTGYLSSTGSSKKCDIFTGEWVRNPDAPYYTNTTCYAIHEHQNCMKYGRPDTDFTKWRWKPDNCELPKFNPAQFLEILRGKSFVFVGDSVARNQLQSLICLLSKVEYPEDVSNSSDVENRRYYYTTYNLTMAILWSPFLVKTKEDAPTSSTPTGLFHLYLDEFNEDWTTKIDEFDYVIISAGHWFSRSSMFYENGTVVGCHNYMVNNVTALSSYYGYRKAFKTAFKAINSLENFKGTTFLRTFAPSHFENGVWNEGGNCKRTRPFMNNETRLEGSDLEFYMTQLEEFKVAEAEGRKKGLKFRLLDTTEAMLLRPDGHPSSYGHLPQANVVMYNDCVHWCLPGPIDTWNDFLLEMLKMENQASISEGKLHSS